MGALTQGSAALHPGLFSFPPCGGRERTGGRGGVCALPGPKSGTRGTLIVVWKGQRDLSPRLVSWRQGAFKSVQTCGDLLQEMQNFGNSAEDDVFFGRRGRRHMMFSFQTEFDSEQSQSKSLGVGLRRLRSSYFACASAHIRPRQMKNPNAPKKASPGSRRKFEISHPHTNAAPKRNARTPPTIR